MRSDAVCVGWMASRRRAVASRRGIFLASQAQTAMSESALGALLLLLLLLLD